uniref:Alkaline phosphatase n=1 Tax=Culicoides sonorensis TaxID=179676 RepID=A0A336K1T2_CULSO
MYCKENNLIIFFVLSFCLVLVSTRSPDYWHVSEKNPEPAKFLPDREKLFHPQFLEKYRIKRIHEAELDSKYWRQIGAKVVQDNIKKEKNLGVAKNIILFIGDGMGVTTTTAARSYLGDANMNLAYEKLPYTGMSKTYCVDRQVADSACSATAYLCGVKTNYQTIGVNANVKTLDCEAAQVEENRTPSIAKWALDAGKAAGFVTTTRVTHASPTGVYGHTAFRDWEHDKKVMDDGCDPAITDDIAEQLVRYDTPSKLRVIMGGGRRAFRPKDAIDEEGDEGKRRDGVDLIQEWLDSKKGQGTYVWNREQLLNVDGNNTQYLLGLFEASHMLYNLETIAMGREEFEPTLTEMVDKAIDVLSTEEKGFFLFIEGGRIDSAHHENWAKVSLDETKEFSKAIEKALSKVDLNETLVVVTADHSHSFTYTGYAHRDDDIFGYTGTKGLDGLDELTLGYANGLGYHDHVNPKGGRIDPHTLPKPYNFRFAATAPKESETHGGEDVGVYAIGPWAHLFSGNFEQVAIPHMMAYASCIGNGLKAYMFNFNIIKFFVILSFCLIFVSARAPDYWRYHEMYSEKANSMVNEEKLMHPEFHDDHPVQKRASSKELNSDYWRTLASDVVEENLKKKDKNVKVAKNIILFLGDGLSVPTTTATRAYLGDANMNLAYEKLPFVGMSKTYCVDRQVADSACTATAYLCGVKANYETIGVNANVNNSDCNAAQEEQNRTPSIAKWAMDAGKGAGLVTTTRVTHASPTGVYGHIAFREWENDAEVDIKCDPTETDDIAEQLVRYDTPSKLRVIMGGGRRNFIPKEMIDEEGDKGFRIDGVNLIKEWLEKKKGKGEYVWNREDLLKVNASNTEYLLGLFETSHMLYNLETIEKGREAFEPTLTEMVDKAIDILDTEEKGYFLFVEGGRIDHAHHDNWAKLSLDETKEFSKAIEMTLKKVNLDETLIVVTADHSHAFSYTGYPNRDRDILGTAGTKALDGMEEMILAYANGLGYHDHVNPEGGRFDPTKMAKPIKFRYPAMVPNVLETHGGDDVGVYAVGPWSHLFTGNFEQFAIPHMMAYASCIGNGLTACDSL